MTAVKTAAAAANERLDRRPARAALALVAGLLIAFSMPPWGWWPLAPLGIGLWAVLLDRPRWTGRFWIGALVAVAWFEPTTLWMYKFSLVGWPIGVAIWFGFLGGVASALCPPTAWRFAALPGALVLSEWLRWHAPFGGVPLSMLAMTQAGGPLLPVARALGSIGVSAAVAAAGGALGALTVGRWRQGVAGLALVAAAAVGGVVAPAGSATGTIRVAAVQGGGPQETRSANTDYGAVFARHLRLSQQLRDVEVIVWPENVVNVNRYDTSAERLQLEQLARDRRATVIAGIVEGAGRQNFRNAVVAIGPDGRQLGRYDKVRRVPYGEYVPLRFLLDPIAKDVLPPRDQIPGRDPNVLRTPAATMGVLVSWEAFFPRRVRTAVDARAEALLNPTNGASYWLTQVQTQQLASLRLRAVESGRWVVEAAPTGFSAFIDPSGRVLERTSLAEPRVLVGRIEARRGMTWATRVGDVPAVALALLFLAVAWAGRPRRPRGG